MPPACRDPAAEILPLARAHEKLKANPKDTTMAAWFDHTFGSGMANCVLGNNYGRQ
jgi:hypothetical protein